MKSLFDELKLPLAHQAAFSMVINVLFLIPAIFMLQVFDRVIPSNSVETLVLLLIGVGVGLSLLLALDYARLRLQHVTGSIIDERLSPQVIPGTPAPTTGIIGKRAINPTGAKSFSTL